MKQKRDVIVTESRQVTQKPWLYQHQQCLPHIEIKFFLTEKSIIIIFKIKKK